MEINAVLVHPDDNVVVVIKAVRAGEPVTAAGLPALCANQDIPKNHKVARTEIAAGEKVVKYGESIGRAAVAVRPGDWVHTHNLKAEA